ncbi:MAG TPA: flavin reductase family protein [Firmicutes bacterium]|nr:flavin reductase family protein [Bacillota bacterium]
MLNVVNVAAVCRCAVGRMNEMAKIARRPGTGLFPLPVVLVSCQAPGGRPNLITLAWVGVAASEPPTISIGVRPERYSHSLIRDSGEFVVNIPDESMLYALDYCGVVSGRNCDKFAEAHLTPSAGHTVTVPHIEEASVSIECQVRQVINVGSHDLFLGEVTAVLAREECITGSGIDLSRVLPIAYGNGRYWSIGKALGDFGLAKT